MSPPAASPQPRARVHVLPAASCIALGTWSLVHVLAAPAGAIPGAGAGDNVTFLWNFWWFAAALSDARWPFRTDLLFFPFGTSLALHTHTAFPAVLSGALSPLADTAGALDAALFAALCANGISAYALCFSYTRAAPASAIGGLLFAGSAFTQSHALGHFNLIHAWVLPVFVLAWRGFLRDGRTPRALILGSAGAVAVYTDYYYALFCALIAVLWTLGLRYRIRIARRPEPDARRWLPGVALSLLAFDALLIAGVLATGGGAVQVAGLEISIRTVRNPLFFGWMLLALLGLLRYRVSVGHPANAPGWPPARSVVVALACAAALSLPLLLAGVDAIAQGDYVAQPVHWRTSPPGVDLGTALLGHPRHVLTGQYTAALYDALSIDPIEQSAWLGFVAMLLLLTGGRTWRTAPGARVWIVLGLGFLVLSAGPFVRIFGFDTGLPMPHALLRYVPPFSNARMPGRAIVVVQLAIVVLVSFRLAALRGRWSAAAIASLLLFESFPAPLPSYRLPPADHVDRVLGASRGEGAVAELPIGLRDGFGEIGRLDHRALVHQMHHRRPLLGGFVARLSPRVRGGYEDSAYLASSLTVSSPGFEGALPEALRAPAAFDLGVAFLVLNRDLLASNAFERTAVEALGYVFVLADGPRELYRVPPVLGPASRSSDLFREEGARRDGTCDERVRDSSSSLKSYFAACWVSCGTAAATSPSP